MDRFSCFCTAYGRKCLYFTMGAPIHQNCPFPWGIWTSHVKRDAFGSCEPTTQTAPRSVQPSSHRWPRSVSIVYNDLPLPMLASRPHVISGSLGPPDSGTQMVTWSFQPFLQGSLDDTLTVDLSVTDRATESPTDRPRYSVRCGGVIIRNYVGYGKATQSFHVTTNNFATINSPSVRSKHLIKYLA